MGLTYTPGPVRRRRPGAAPPDFISSDQTITADTDLDIAHGLGVLPSRWNIVLKCTTATYVYSIDDEVLLAADSGTADRGLTTFANSTNISLNQGAAINIHYLSANAQAAAATSWVWVARAWK